MSDWISVKDRLPESNGPWQVLCPASGNGKLPEETRLVYFNTEQGRSHRCLETKGVFRCIRLITHWKE